MQLPTSDVSRPLVFEGSLVESGEARLLRTLLWDGLLSGDDAVALTQVEAAARSGVSRPSVKNYVGAMPPSLFRDGSLALSPDAGYALGVDFGRTHAVKVVLTNIRGGKEELTPKVESDPEELGLRPNETISRAVVRIKAVLEKAKVHPGKLVGIGVGLPTPAVGQSPSDAAIGHWRRRDPAGELRKALQKAMPEIEEWKQIPIAVDNDTNLSAVANHLWGAERADDTLYVKWMAGLRAALILDNRLYRGSSNAAGELPHVKVEGSTAFCGLKACPVGEGCIYGAAPIERIRGFVHDALGRDVLWAEDIMAEAIENEPLRTHLEHIANAIGHAVAPVAVALNPSLIVMGGAMGARAYPMVLDEFARGFEQDINLTLGSAEQTQSGGDGMVIITRSTQENHTTVMGAAALALIEFGTQFLMDCSSSLQALRQAV